MSHPAVKEEPRSQRGAPPPKVLIVDDNPTNVELISVQLRPYDYEILKAYGGEEALEIVRKDPPDLLLLDLMMPKMSGYEVCRLLKNDPATRLIPIVIVTALRELDDKIRAIELGADDFLMKPYNKLELTARVKSLLRVKQLYNELDSSEAIVFTLAETLEAKDLYTRGHSERVSKYSVLLGKHLKLTEPELDDLKRGSLLHDIGKIGIQECVLNKKEPLNEEEMAHVRTHPVRGYEICHRLKSFKNLLPVIRSHHERWDGCGYPDRIGNTDIPLLARVCAVTDAFDAMTSNRPYRKGVHPLQAIEIFEREVDAGQWEPDIVKKFIELVRTSFKGKGA